MSELRCDSKLHGILVSSNVIQVSCSSRYCGANSEVVVLHEFDVRTGLMTSTKRYKKPRRN